MSNWPGHKSKGEQWKRRRPENAHHRLRHLPFLPRTHYSIHSDSWLSLIQYAALPATATVLTTDTSPYNDATVHFEFHERQSLIWEPTSLGGTSFLGYVQANSQAQTPYLVRSGVLLIAHRRLTQPWGYGRQPLCRYRRPFDQRSSYLVREGIIRYPNNIPSCYGFICHRTKP